MKRCRPRVRAILVAAVVTATVGRACLLCLLSPVAGTLLEAKRGAAAASDDASAPTSSRLAPLLAAASRRGQREWLSEAAPFRLGLRTPLPPAAGGGGGGGASGHAAAAVAATERPWAPAQRRLTASFSADDEEEAMTAVAPGGTGDAGGGANAAVAVDDTTADAAATAHAAAAAGSGGGSPPEASIAYFLQVSPANVRLLPRLVRAVYHPANVYAVHFDVKISAADMQAATEGMAAVVDDGGGSQQRPATATTSTEGSTTRPALPPNIHLMERRPITYRGVTTVLNTLDGMELLTTRGGHWDYFINLSAADYPLLGVRAVRRLLGRPDVRRREANFLTFHPVESWAAATTSRFSRMTLDLGLTAPAGAAAPQALATGASDGPTGTASITTASAATGASASSVWDASKRGATLDAPLFRTGVDNPLLASRRGPLAKGGAWMILTRSFVTHALTSSDARRALLTVSNGLSASEHFFPTLLVASPVYRSTIVPHGMRAVYWDALPAAGTASAPGQPALVVQHPRVLDAVSHQVGDGGGGGDFLNRIAACPYLFARKFSRPTSPLLTYIDTQMSGLAGAAANESAVRAVVERANRHMDWLLAEASLPAQVSV